MVQAHSQHISNISILYMDEFTLALFTTFRVTVIVIQTKKVSCKHLIDLKKIKINALNIMDKLFPLQTAACEIIKTWKKTKKKCNFTTSNNEELGL